MIVLIKDGAKEEQVRQLIERLESFGFQVHVSKGVVKTILGLVGNTARLDIDLIRSMEIVQDVKRVQEPYKNANRKFHPEDTVITVGGVTIGGGKPVLIAGPCSVESEDQILQVARAVKRSGAGMLRGGAFKPRTSPYSFQGLGAEGIRLLLLAKEETGLPIVTEIMDQGQLPFFDGVDVFQVGARNMQNYELLRVLGTLRKPVLLKRGFSNTLEELLMSAEYIMAGGNEQVILCERGIRTFETATRNTLDLSAVPVLKQLSHLPVVIDPSHSTGMASLVRPMSLSAIAAGADGLIIEVHNDPPHALSDGPQSLTPEAFDDLAKAADLVFQAVLAGTAAMTS
ncbi:MAG: Phospho-2-dehydro-3-deoxyheptonate aldolase [Synergistetes bacterium ADurb.Bin155]|jgi:3-deoxy-7-phosphoheptulonate synthase|nr:3-deoxy-7-phosphoheptulonate synthase [Synergistales bacterium]NMD17221.1 3-deoxy-7-phosphoheptulonate synthase [Synergistaceae bacterium]OQB44835.1 MAG: Phospho-2-dehydro-3-deoxyheptonate aldolase [Synergistetes bacterium ADurb.Bin155]HOC81393.1 3-deoxy-7-phosphoheptulonate synthase [Synergistales bacterium]HQL01900.1 3-deoxy-7-phosphoheptulonate synthase [Synergistales bacterium]